MTAPVPVVGELWVPEAQQWVATSAGRAAGDGYSWMQAVHWVAGSGAYVPRRHRRHGPAEFGRMTVYVAQLLSELTPCRPGIEYLMRRTGLSRRAVSYHLQMLRETGLLVWELRGTRVRGERAQASVYVRVIPPEFDQALGVRTTGEGVQRRVVGVAESGRALVAKLAARAARKVRRPRRPGAKPTPSTTASSASAQASTKGSKTLSRSDSHSPKKSSNGAAVTAGSEGPRCTPMVGGALGAFPCGSLVLTSEEAKLASGQHDSSPSTPKDTSATASPRRGRRRRLNAVGRRYQLAAELIAQVPWLSRASRPRVAWIVKDVADAGWTVEEVRAWLDLGSSPEAEDLYRPSGLLARRLTSAHLIWSTPLSRNKAVEEWKELQRITYNRRQRTSTAPWTPPRSAATRQALADAVNKCFPRTTEPQGGVVVTADTPPLVSPEEAAQLRAAARKALALGDPSLITSTLDTLGEQTTEDIYGPELLLRARQLAHNTASPHTVFHHA